MMKKLVVLLLLAVNVGVALLMVGATLAGVVGPSRFIGFSLLGYGFPLLLGLNVVFLLLWLLGGRRFWWVSAAAIVLRAGFVPLFVQLGGSEEAAPVQGEECLKVMSFNTHLFSGRDEGLSAEDLKTVRQENAGRFLTMVKKEGCDVLCLQEFFDIRNRDISVSDSLESYGYRYRYGVDMSREGLPRGVALFSRFPIDYVCNLDTERKFYVDIIKGGSIVRVVCVHLASYGFTEKDSLRDGSLIKELEEAGRHPMDVVAGARADSIAKTFPIIAKLSRTILSHEQEWNGPLKSTITASPRPILVAGDFNDTPASYIYQKMRRLMKDSYVEQGRGFSTTYHGMFPNYRIDYLWHSEDIEALSYKRIRTDVSDHYPIVVTFRLP